MTRIAVYCFANTSYFFQRLIIAADKNEDIEWSVILPRWHNRKIFVDLIPAENILYLYQEFNRRYKALKSGAALQGFEFSANADSEFVCLSKDKGGFSKLSGSEQLQRAAVITDIYREFLEKTRPDYMLFPDLEVVDGFLLMSLCVSMGIRPIYYVGMRLLGGGFLSENAYEKLPAHFGKYTPEDLSDAEVFLQHYLTSKQGESAFPVSTSAPMLKVQPLWRRALTSAIMHFRYESKYVGEDNWYIRLRANFLPILTVLRRLYFDCFQAHLFDIKKGSIGGLPPHFGFYALQYTPESSINGLEPYFTDQLRVIDALLAAMPSGYKLLVKEHPAIVGLRSNSFYKKLKRRAGVVLVSPDSPTRTLLQASSFAATVTGTIGLEAYLLGKPCILFGRNFFSHLCLNAQGPRDVRRAVMHAVTKFQAPTLEQRSQEVARLFAIRSPIELTDPFVNPVVLSRHNIQEYLAAINRYIASNDAHSSA